MDKPSNPLNTWKEFWDKATPIWFQYLGWFLALGAIGIAAEKTKSLGLIIVYGITYVFFFMFINFKNSETLDIQIIRNKSLNNFLTLILSLLILTFTIYTLHSAINGIIIV